MSGAGVPDRVAAIVDLMSHLFMLAVMLFVLAIPFRTQTAASNLEKLDLNLYFYAAGELVDVGLDELVYEGTPLHEIEIDVRLDDGTSSYPWRKGLKRLQIHALDKHIGIEGYVEQGKIKAFVVFLTNIGNTSLVSKNMVVDLNARSSSRPCIVSWSVVIGHDAAHRFDLDTCESS